MAGSFGDLPHGLEGAFGGGTRAAQGKPGTQESGSWLLLSSLPLLPGVLEPATYPPNPQFPH